MQFWPLIALLMGVSACATRQAPIASPDTRAAITAQGVDLVVSGCVELDQVKGAVVYAEESHALAERIAANIKTMLSAKGIPVNAVHFPFVCGFPNAEGAHMITEPGGTPKAVKHPVVLAGPHAPTSAQAAELFKWRCHMHPVKPWDYSKYRGAAPAGFSCCDFRNESPLDFEVFKSYLPNSRYVLFAHGGIRTESKGDRALEFAVGLLGGILGAQNNSVDHREGFEAALYDLNRNQVLWADGTPGYGLAPPGPCYPESDNGIDFYTFFTFRSLLCSFA